MKSNKKITGSTLKIIACISMFIDHLAATVLDNYLLSTKGTSSASRDFLLLIDDVMRCIGRVAFPIFCFLMIEGFKHTHSKLKYARNLAVFALISEIPFNLSMYRGKIIYPGYQNVFFTLLLAVLVLLAVDLIQKKEFSHKIFTPFAFLGGLIGGILTALLWDHSFLGSAIVLHETATGLDNSLLSLPAELAGCGFAIFYSIKQFTRLAEERIKDCLCLLAVLAAAITAILIHCDYGSFGVVTIVLMYMLNTKCRANNVLTFFAGCIALFLLNPIEAFCCFGLIPIALYNGERGLKSKYAFYVFYPGHLLVFYLICLVLNLI